MRNVGTGVEIYHQACASCHGTETRRATAVHLFNPFFLESASDAFLSYAISHGRPGTEMQAWAGTLSAAEINDVVAYLREAPYVPESAGREIQIGGPDVMEHLDVIGRYAEETGRRPPLRVALPDAIASPGVVSAGAATVTSGSPAVAAELSFGLRDDTSVTDPSGAALFDIEPEPLNVAIQRAIAEQERGDG